VSPILVRPVREQLEHDRLIRFLQTKYKRKFEAVTNVGDEQAAPVKIGAGTFFPDLVLTSGRKLAGVVEVESAESVNNLEAMAEWVHFARARVPFHLYVPVQMFDVARRLSEANHAAVSEIWTYRPSNEGFDLMRAFHEPSAAPARPPAAASKGRGAAGRGKKKPPARAARGAKRAAATTRKPAARGAKPGKKGARPARAGAAKR
jgi:hypothetical protein